MKGKFNRMSLAVQNTLGYDLNELAKRIPIDVKLASFSPRQLEDLRKDLGLEQKDLANISGVSQQNISNYERGLSSPKEEDLRKLGKALKVVFICDWIDDDWEKETPRFKKKQGE